MLSGPIDIDFSNMGKVTRILWSKILLWRIPGFLSTKLIARESGIGDLS